MWKAEKAGSEPAMKPPSASGSPGSLDRKKAWSCLMSNLAMPGVGSLAAGHRIGWWQLIFGPGGFALTMIFGLRFILWYFANQNRLQQPQEGFDVLIELWQEVRFALLGMAVFGIGLLWALITSISIVRLARRTTPPPLASDNGR